MTARISTDLVLRATPEKARRSFCALSSNGLTPTTDNYLSEMINLMHEDKIRLGRTVFNFVYK